MQDQRVKSQQTISDGREHAFWNKLIEYIKDTVSYTEETNLWNLLQKIPHLSFFFGFCFVTEYLTAMSLKEKCQRLLSTSQSVADSYTLLQTKTVTCIYEYHW